MNNARAAAISAASERLRGCSGDLLDRAHHAVQGSHDVLSTLRVAREQWATWKALWRVLCRVPRGRRTLPVCGFCRRVRTPSGAWVSIPAGMVSTLEGRLDVLPLSHGICPPCTYEHYGMALDDDDGG